MTSPQHSAFPTPDNYCESGVTVREYFAAQAMTGFISGMLASGNINDDREQVNSAVARYSVELADALIKALNKE